MNAIKPIATAALCAVALLTGAAPAAAADRAPHEVIRLGTLARVTDVIDAQTLRVSIGGNVQTVRLAGVVSPGSGACGADQAVNAARALLTDKLVVLEKDAADTQLNNVFIIDGRFANAALVATGWLRTDPAQTAASRYYELLAAESGARAAAAGAWGTCGAGSSASTAPAANAATPGCVSISFDALLQRVPRLREQDALRAGDCVTITSATDSGRYIYRPAGSQVRLVPMIVRWKDGAITLRANTDGGLDAHYVDNIPPSTSVRIGPTGPIFTTTPGRAEAEVRALGDQPDTGTFGIPGGTAIFRKTSPNTATVLIDAFEFVSGDMPQDQP